MKNGKNKEFSYTYSAGEQAEVRRIREKYAPTARPEDKLARLRRLDAGVTQAAQAVALVFGVLGALILGFGMSLCMTDLGALLGLSARVSMVLGIAVGIAGGILAGLAYPMYNVVLENRRKRLAPEIISLTDELMK